MKQSIFIVLLFFTATCVAQKDLPQFGKIDKADLEMQDCDFDKGANAVKLIDWGNTYYDKASNEVSLYKTVFERRTRIKILKEEGLNEADIRIPFYNHNNEEKILRLSAYTYNLDAAGNVQATEVKKSSIYTKKIDGYYGEMIIAFPDVKVGSIIEYKYAMERETMGQLRDWFFQENIPVKYSEYQLTIPTIFLFSVKPSVVDPVEEKQKVVNEFISSDKGLISTKALKSNYVMRNLPGIKEEPFMGSPKDYVQRLEFQLKQVNYGNGNVVDFLLKWSDVVADLANNEDFGGQLDKEVPDATILIQQAIQIKDSITRMKFIFDYLRKNISWNDVEDIYTDNGVNKTWQTKSGNAADINLLLVKLLLDAGLQASPILFSTRDHGSVTPYYTYLNQFNTVMAYVTIDGKKIILDATDKMSNYKLVPEKIVNTQGFIVTGENGRWENILAGQNKYKVVVATHGEIDDAGNMRGDCLVNSMGYSRKQRCLLWMQNKDKFKETYFSNPNAPLRIEDIIVNNVDADSLPLEQKIRFNSLLNSSGNYKYFNINLFSDLDRNPFVADERVADIDFAFKQEYTLFGNYTIPENYEFDTLPENIYMIMPDTSIIFTRLLQADDNLLNVKISLEFKQTVYSAANYPEFKEFYKKLFAKLNEQIVIKKKDTP